MKITIEAEVFLEFFIFELYFALNYNLFDYWLGASFIF